MPTSTSIRFAIAPAFRTREELFRWFDHMGAVAVVAERGVDGSWRGSCRLPESTAVASSQGVG
jgi:hypothetical protein